MDQVGLTKTGGREHILEDIKCTLSSSYLKRALGRAADSPESSGLTGGSTSSPPEQTSGISTVSAARTTTTGSKRKTLTWGYRLLMLLSVPSGSLTSSVSLTAWTVVALGCLVKAST